MKISEYFYRDEFECSGTGSLMIQAGFLDDADSLRSEYGNPLYVTSGCRTKEHNESIGGHPHSLHLIENSKYGTDTCAMDVARPDSILLAKLIKAALFRGWSVGVADTFVHLDMRHKYAGLPQKFYTYGD